MPLAARHTTYLTRVGAVRQSLGVHVAGLLHAAARLQQGCQVALRLDVAASNKQRKQQVSRQNTRGIVEGWMEGRREGNLGSKPRPLVNIS